MARWTTSVYVTQQDTYDAAMMAAGSSIELVDQIVSGQLKHGLAIVR